AIGFDAGILASPDEPAWPYKASYDALRAVDRETTTPRRWLKESVLWYSRVLVEKLGAERFAAYVRALDYGNADVSGDPGAGNGMTHSWLNSSLQITPLEQARFVQRLVGGVLPVSAQAHRNSIAALPRFDGGSGWRILGNGHGLCARAQWQARQTAVRVVHRLGRARREGSCVRPSHRGHRRCAQRGGAAGARRSAAALGEDRRVAGKKKGPLGPLRIRRVRAARAPWSWPRASRLLAPARTHAPRSGGCVRGSHCTPAPALRA